MDSAFLSMIGNIIFGGYFAFMGFNHFARTAMLAQYAASKGVPNPKIAVLGSGALIFLGGIGVISGMSEYWGISLWLIIIFLVPVSFKMHAFWSIQDQNMKMIEMTNFLKNAALTGAALAMM